MPVCYDLVCKRGEGLGGEEQGFSSSGAKGSPPLEPKSKYVFVWSMYVCKASMECSVSFLVVFTQASTLARFAEENCMHV